MRFAVIQFPGSNCDVDLLHAIRDGVGEEAEYVSHMETSLDGFDGVLLPGGFSYGDYLRSGAISRFSNVMSEVRRFAEEGKPVFGTCNGFQILVEAGLLPGALQRNKHLHFICKSVQLKVENNKTNFTSLYEKGEQLTIPIAHGEGSYYCDPETLEELERSNQIVFTYASENPNGSVADIAGIINKKGNVLGMMPHPERATEELLGSSDGLRFFQSMIKNFVKEAANV